MFSALTCCTSLDTGNSLTACCLSVVITRIIMLDTCCLLPQGRPLCESVDSCVHYCSFNSFSAVLRQTGPTPAPASWRHRQPSRLSLAKLHHSVIHASVLLHCQLVRLSTNNVSEVRRTRLLRGSAQGVNNMRVDLSPRLGGTHVCPPPNRGERSTASRAANHPPTTVLLSFTILPPPERCKVSQQVWNRVMNWTWTCVSPYCDLLD